MHMCTYCVGREIPLFDNIGLHVGSRAVFSREKQTVICERKRDRDGCMDKNCGIKVLSWIF